jgi:rare lipoprotein A
MRLPQRIRIGRPARHLPALVLMLAAACTQVPPAPAPEPAPPAPVPSAPAPEPQAPAPKPPPQKRPTVETGKASFYAMSFAGKKTASGAIFDPEALTMAHRTLPLGTRVRVTNLRNQRSVELVVNDRGPMVEGRIADLSPAAARAIGLNDGLADVRLEVLSLPD